MASGGRRPEIEARAAPVGDFHPQGMRSLLKAAEACMLWQ
jgi:hypothetical protein